MQKRESTNRSAEFRIGGAVRFAAQSSALAEQCGSQRRVPHWRSSAVRSAEFRIGGAVRFAAQSSALAEQCGSQRRVPHWRSSAVRSGGVCVTLRKKRRRHWSCVCGVFDFSIYGFTTQGSRAVFRSEMFSGAVCFLKRYVFRSGRLSGAVCFQERYASRVILVSTLPIRIKSSEESVCIPSSTHSVHTPTSPAV